jgi:hypothetical protein
MLTKITEYDKQSQGDTNMSKPRDPIEYAMLRAAKKGGNQAIRVENLINDHCGTRDMSGALVKSFTRRWSDAGRWEAITETMITQSARAADQILAEYPRCMPWHIENVAPAQGLDRGGHRR